MSTIAVRLLDGPSPVADVTGSVKYTAEFSVNGELFSGLVVQRPREDGAAYGETMIRGPLYRALADRFGWQGEKWPGDHWVYDLGAAFRAAIGH